MGLALGAAGAVALTRAAASLTYGVTAGDPLTWTAVIGSLALLALAAGIRPAREAMRLDPVQLLRHE
jgi:putative ABC transport system permease protein